MQIAFGHEATNWPEGHTVLAPYSKSIQPG